MSDELTRDAFARQLDTQFRVERQDGGTVTLDLVEASEVRLMPGSESFSIVFRGPLGAFDLFIVPIRRDDPGFYYQAVFNRMCQEGQA